MSLFKSDDLMQPAMADEHVSAIANNAYSPAQFATGEQLGRIASTIGSLLPGRSCYFVTNGAWSNIELLEHCLRFTGPANVYFTTWAISAEAITRFAAWHQDLAIIDLWAVLDAGLSNRKPEVYQQATGTFKYLRTCKCHAKVTVIENDDHHIVIMGSANYTKNPRREAGVIIWDKSIAQANINWILEEFKND